MELRTHLKRKTSTISHWGLITIKKWRQSKRRIATLLELGVPVLSKYNIKQKNLTVFTMRLIIIKNWHLPTLPGLIQVPSAVRGLTALFEMGRGDHPPY